MYAIDLTPLQPLLSNALLGILTALASVVAAKACALLKARRDGELGQILDKALGMGIAFAMSKLDALEAGRLKIDVKSDVLAEAANYTLAHVPEAVKALGLDGDHLQRMIEARLQATEPAA
jgi:hypothetical protein